VLAVDAFSSDSVPVHLLTQEAFDVYRRHLREPDGVLAFHVTNGFLDLRPVVAGLAERAGMESAVITWEKNEGMDAFSTWVLVARPGRLLAHPTIAAAAVRRSLLPRPGRPWTDDWSNLLDAALGR